ncbi:MAG: hypothetical protein V4495_02935 [Pseudomonadota bacterium]
MMVRIPVSSVKEDRSYPDKDTLQMYEHLKYRLSKPRSFPLSAIRVALVAGEVIVIGKHKYLQIARELGIEYIRATIRGDEFAKSDLLKLLPKGSEQVPDEELEREMQVPVIRDFHVYFFYEALNEMQQREFVNSVAGFFEKLKTPLLQDADKRVFSWNFPFGGRCAEFEANFPVGDRSWANDYLRVTQEFSKKVARIITFQGSYLPE